MTPARIRAHVHVWDIALRCVPAAVLCRDSYLSSGTTLHPGTVILTGTPAGVGYKRSPPRFLQRGDEVSVSIEHIGQLLNPVQ